MHILKTYDRGLLVRLSQDKEAIYITDIKTGEIEEFKTQLPREDEILKALDLNSERASSSIPQSMQEIIQSVDIT